MIEIQFDVNDEKLRSGFFLRTLPQAVNNLNAGSPHGWGRMSAHHMIEHLIFTFEISTGKITIGCRTPEKLLPRVKAFLHNNSEMPHDFKNPILPDEPPAMRYTDFDDAKNALLKEIKGFLEKFQADPEAVCVHPVFGALGRDEWERAHFKHCCHHLLQFGIISRKQII